MPLPFLILLGTGLLGGLVASVALWTRVLDWARDSLVPALKEIDPKLAELAVRALVKLDEFASPLKVAVTKAWNALRGYLLKQILKLQQRTEWQWVKEVTSWILPRLESKQVEKVTTRQTIPFEELPAELRKERLVNDKTSRKVDVTKARDSELAVTS